MDDFTKKLIEGEENYKLSNLYERARQSLQIGDIEHAAEYYLKILDEKPNDWEAYFYSYLGEVARFSNAEADSVALKLMNTIPPAYNFAIENGGTEEEIAHRLRTISEKTAERLKNIAYSTKGMISSYEGGNVLTTKGRVIIDLYNQLRPVAQNTILSCIVALESFETKIDTLSNENNNIDPMVWKECKLAFRKATYYVASIEFRNSDVTTETMITKEAIRNYAIKVNELDSSFEIPSSEPSSANSGGCYVATAVYGSYDCPQVWTLRRFRDDTLAETWYGRTFIRVYYAISPMLVKRFGETGWFKQLWRKPLDRLVHSLNEEGVENTPYNDRQW